MSHYFAYLHVHSYFSRGGGPHSPDDWCRAAAKLGYRALALTDRGPMAGFPAFARAARKAGLVAVYGVEVDVVLPGGGASGRKGGEPVVVPVTLYARDGEGMSNLARLCSLAHAGWPRREEALAWEALAQRAAGLVMALPGGDEAGALSPFVGFVGKKLGELGGQIKEAFGESAFVGLPHSGRPGDSALAASVMSAAYQMGVPVVAMPSARYIRPEDAPAYEALKVARARAGWPEESGNGNGFGHTGSTAIDRPGPYWMRSRDDVEELFKEWPSAMENVGRVVELCSNAEFGIRNSELTGIEEWVEKRLVERLGVGGVTEEVRERLRGELEVVEKRGAGGAWAGLGALVEAAWKGNVLLGAPLGVADGSLVGFALGLSAGWTVGDGPVVGEGVLPLPGVEVPAGRREELLGALAQEFGAGRVALGACSLDITPMSAARAAGGVMGVAGEELKALVDGA
ncbi:MAG TPA: PHP domain-containing protein, partial [Chloroflexia bacterium]